MGRTESIRHGPSYLDPALGPMGVSFDARNSQFTIRPWRFRAGHFVATAGAFPWTSHSLVADAAHARSHKKKVGFSPTASKSSSGGRDGDMFREFALGSLRHARDGPGPARKLARGGDVCLAGVHLPLDHRGPPVPQAPRSP